MGKKERIDRSQQARRVAQDFRAGEVVGLGPGMPALIPAETPPGWGALFLADSGALGYCASFRPAGSSSATAEALDGPVDSNGGPVDFSPGGVVLSLLEVAAMIRGGYVGTAVLQPDRVGPTGDFIHWTAAQTPGLYSLASAWDWALGARRVIAMMPHTSLEGSPNIVAKSQLPLGGVGSVETIITDVAVLKVAGYGLEVVELAPGWGMDELAAITDAPLTASPSIKEMTFDLPHLDLPNKVYSNGLETIQDLPDGAVVNIDGFAGPGGMAHYLLTALRDKGAKDLTLISNTAGIARVVDFGTPPGLQAIDHSILVDHNQVAKAIASYPVSPRASLPSSFELAYQRGEVDLEVVPQGTLAERLRAGGAGVAAFYTPTGAGTLLVEGKETRTINGREYVLETALTADFCLIRGHKADTLGNLVYKGTSRNFNAVMAPAARVTVVEVDEIVETGTLSPEEIVTPGVYVDRIVQRPADFSPYE